MISVLTDDGVRRQWGPAELDDLLSSLRGAGAGVTWVHLDPEDAVDDALERFGLHELVLRGLKEGPERPRVVEYGDHLYVSFSWVPPTGPGSIDGAAARGEAAVTLPAVEVLRVFLAERWLVSRGRLSETDLDELSELVGRQVVDRARGPSYILYYLADWAVETVDPVIDDVVERVGELEELAVEEDGYDFRRQLLALKRDVVVLRRGMVPMRDVMQRLSGRGLPFLDDSSMVFFRDVHDDVLAVLEQLDMQHDILASTLDLHLSAVSNRLNMVMRSLTVVATIFMPLTFITGFFGQNFVQLPFRSDVWFVAMLGLTVGVAAAMLSYFRRKHWM